MHKIKNPDLVGIFCNNSLRFVNVSSLEVVVLFV